MDSIEDTIYGYDSINECDFEEEDCISQDSKSTLNNEYYEDFKYDVLSTEDIVKDMLTTIKDVNAIVKIPPTITRILLNHFKWDREKLLERYYDEDPESLYKEVRIVNPYSKVPKIKPSKEKEKCEICFMKLPRALCTSLACGHRYCIECWTRYLTTKIMNEGEVQSIPCIDLNCDILVDDQTIIDLLVEPEVKLKYQYLITNNFITSNRLLTHCPQPDCSKVIKVEYAEARNVTCSCGRSFCFECSEVCHEPIPCLYFKKWQKKYAEQIDSLTVTWIDSNTKECPKCNAPIEKNSGCDVIVCRCKFRFCWRCLSSCTYMGNGCKCPESNTQKMSRQYSIMDDFYSSRYVVNRENLKVEKEWFSFNKLQMGGMQRNNIPGIDTQVLETGSRNWNTFELGEPVQMGGMQQNNITGMNAQFLETGYRYWSPFDMVEPVRKGGMLTRMQQNNITAIDAQFLETGSRTWPPVQIPFQLPLQCPPQLSVQSTFQLPVQSPVELPVQSPVELPVQSPVEFPVQSPVELPVQSPVQLPVPSPFQQPVPSPFQRPVPIPFLQRLVQMGGMQNPFELQVQNRGMELNNITGIEAQFLETAVYILCECRQTLMYTYAFAFYLVKDNETQIFVENLEDLQNAVGELSEFLKYDFSYILTNLAIKQTVQDKFMYCDRRRRALLSHVYEGYSKATWRYSES